MSSHLAGAYEYALVRMSTQVADHLTNSFLVVCWSNIVKYCTLPHNGSFNMLIGHTCGGDDIGNRSEEEPWSKCQPFGL